MRRHFRFAGLGATLVVTGAVLIATQVTSAAPIPVAQQATPAPTATPLTVQQLSDIQPGLGTVMIEYSHRMAALWFAEQAGNWDMASYQILEMREIQEVGETTRPARANALKSFESSFLDPLDDAAKAQDKTKFESAYQAAIQGCNSCHGSQTSSDYPGSYKFVKVQVPKDTLESLVSY